MSWHCEVCDNYFKESKILEDHMNEIHPTYKCDVCISGFPSLEELARHSATHEKRPEEKLNRRHSYTRASKKRKFEKLIHFHGKDVRNKTSTNDSSSHPVQLHSYEQHGSKLSSDLAQIDSADQSLLSSHPVQLHCYEENESILSSDLAPSRSCEENDLILASELSQEHSNEHDETVFSSGHAQTRSHQQRSHECDTCGERFATTSDLMRHYYVEHSDRNEWFCKFCGSAHLRLSILRKHYRVEHGYDEEEEMVQCEKCGKLTKRKNLRYHMRNHVVREATEKPFLCEICGSAFKTRVGLKGHSFVHTNEKPHKCDICGFAFKQAMLLARHALVHKDDRPFLCNVCGKAFSRKRTLKSHLDTHSNEQRYGCSFCARRFTKPDALKVHLRTHTKEKPYVCEKCGKSASHKVSLKNHVCVVPENLLITPDINDETKVFDIKEENLDLFSGQSHLIHAYDKNSVE